jgi:hypothetical protein
MLTSQIENPDNLDGENAEEARTMITKILEKGENGRPAALTSFINHLSISENPLVVNRKHPAVKTMTDWIDECIKMGRAELER